MRPNRKKKRSKNPKRKSTHSATVIDQKRALAALGAHGEAFGEHRRETLLEPLLRLYERLLEGAAEDLDRADAAGWRRELRLSALRSECRRAKGELYAVAVKVRKALVGLVGSARCRLQFGLSERTPRGATGLAIETRRLMRRLTDPGVASPAPPIGDLEVDPAGLAGRLRPGLERLERLLREVERQRVVVEDGVLDRRAALEASGEIRQQVTGVCQGLFDLAGRKHLARRLRLKSRRLRDVTWAPRRRPAAAWLRRILSRLRAAFRLFERVATFAA